MAVLLAPLAFHAAVADDVSDVARAATRRNTPGTTITTTRKKSTNIEPKVQTSTSRATNVGKSGTVVRDRTQNTSPRDGTTATRTGQTTTTKAISARTATKVQPRTIKTTTRTAQPRNMTRTATPITRVATKPRVGTTATRARNATTTTATDMMERDFSKCRTVFYDCMDEFCANKDTQLKRCACSSRIHEFDGTKQNLANVEEKLLDFSQRLLTVNMDKEDAAALYKPTEGELAFATQDTSASKKMLDEIAKKLNTSFNDSNFDQNLNAISLSLNMDSAFDTIDSMAGASTTAKSGTDLYTAALPICREMALEICTTDDLAIAESSYQMAIESDCNTVKKSYQTQVDRAREQVFESGALLDMSRLDIHQKRNSDDILTCKHKMLEMLTDSTVCGTDMGKCLDTSGRYIDPTTGTAFLTPELANLATLISRPDTGQTWRTAPGNDRFIAFLNSKRKFLEPAMEHCQDISDYVWDAFIDDALSQIKLAQDAKLEEMRQSCTTLTAQCLNEAYDSITDFDARALSIFGVAADRTVNAMCTDIKNACTALMDTSGGAENWQSGMTEIATDKTYETIIQTCREVGRNCIIQTCTSVSGNFGLCENIDTSINRKSIINRTACWDQVVECIASAGNDSLTKIQELHPLDVIAGTATLDAGSDTPPESERPSVFRTFYGQMYGITDEANITLTTDSQITKACITGLADNTNCVHDICANVCNNEAADSPVSTKCYTCRLAESIWGNCEAPSNTTLANKDNNSTAIHNTIKTTGINNAPIDTLLAWFAKNTGTSDKSDSCRDTSCRPGYVFANNGTCVPPSDLDDSGHSCPEDNRFEIYEGHDNCCNLSDGVSLTNSGDCCAGQSVSPQSNQWFSNTTDNTIANQKICSNSNSAQLAANYTANNNTYNIVCLGNIEWDNDTSEGNYPNGTEVKCNGTLVSIDQDGRYTIPTESNERIYLYYYNTAGVACIFDGTKWNQCTDGTECSEQNPDNWYISYDDICAKTRA